MNIPLNYILNLIITLITMLWEKSIDLINTYLITRIKTIPSQGINTDTSIPLILALIGFAIAVYAIGRAVKILIAIAIVLIVAILAIGAL